MALGISVGWQKREECWLIRNSLRLFPESRSVRYTSYTHTHTHIHRSSWCTISWTISIYAHVRTWLRASNGWFANAETCCSVCNLCRTCGNNKRPTTVLYYQAHTVYTILSFGIFSIIFIIEPVQLVVRHHRANENNNTESRFGARYLSVLYGRHTSIVCAFKIYIWHKSSQQQQQQQHQPHKSC